ncbi:MAG: UDP-N-acetylglucosamine 1-carboxyvinyltransferase [Gammaproteobacteria bacterium]|nr:UDP-N-acetylglucosamine 1-carboxyvinyltransferase [Gammaproteobacteria bacterium]
MDKMLITGGTPLYGEIVASGSKNASLPMMAASLLTSEPVMLHRVPKLQDVNTMCDLLKHLGVTVSDLKSGNLQFQASSLKTDTAPYDLVRKMRASFLVLGPLVTRFGHAKVSLPGGCAIGTRPVDQHLKALSQLGAEITVDEGYVVATASNGLTGSNICMDVVTVTGTQNTLLAAVLARGSTRIENAACEPEVVSLATMLNDMGARIRGAGTRTIEIEGVDKLGGISTQVPTDRIEVGTYLVAAFATQGKIVIKDAPSGELQTVIEKLEEAGASIDVSGDAIQIDGTKRRPQSINVETEVYPGVPTDLQAQFMVLNTISAGESRITENIFENRFMHVQELVRLGAKVRLNGPSEAIIEGVDKLRSAPVMATDLRASSSLVIAGLIAEGQTTINRIYHLDRGYEDLDQKLTSLGATLSRVS